MPDLKEHSLSIPKPVPTNRRPSVPSSPMMSPASNTHPIQPLSPFLLSTEYIHELDHDTQHHPDPSFDICQSVPAFEIEIDHDNLLSGVATVIDSVFPEWEVDQDVRLVQCTNGITNKLVRCTHAPTGNSVLVRTYGRGSGVLIDREQELVLGDSNCCSLHFLYLLYPTCSDAQNMLALSRGGMCPPLHGRFTNGIVYGFTEGDVFSVSDAIPQTYSSTAKVSKFLDSGISIGKLRSDLSLLQSHLEALNSPWYSVIVICYLETSFTHPSKTVSVLLITQQKAWLSTYWAESNYTAAVNYNPEARHNSPDTQLEATAPLSPEQLHNLYKEILKFSLAAHFFWAVWALVQAEISDLDFDYLNYAVMRLDEYNRRKEDWLKL
ncbi:hypothetical protein BSLG_006586 [Batrachochytrium salamandrivorans]|nr:hypothetical protein BSLG_006586 [Batrachochytrium salamandrivorans]